MSAKVAQPQKPAEATPQAKEAAKQCLVLADKFIKDGDFVKARTEVEKAQKLDPTNMYIFAFRDRINHFEELKKKVPPPPPATPPGPPAKTAEPASPPAPAPTPPSTPSAPPPPAPPPKPTPSYTPRPQAASGDKADLESKLEAMRKQIELLTNAMEQERKVREEMKQQEIQASAKQLRLAMEKAWMNGAPKEREAQALHDMAQSLGIPEDVEHKLQREVKLDMYSRAVKEVVAKRKLLKNSNTTLEWLRKVYQITLDEYLEYESKFLMDLVADQFKGSILFVSSDERAARDLSTKLKTSGYAVVMALTPENALEKIEKVNPHFIICDSQFPEANLSGIKFLHLLRINPKFNYLPFILLCTKEEAQQMKSSELRPTEGYIEKPVDFDGLTALMAEKAEQFRSYISSM